MKIAGKSDTGLMRKLNEDSIFYLSFELGTYSDKIQAGILAVADGMGGHNAGEIASAIAIRHFCKECLNSLLTNATTPILPIMANAFKEANKAIIDAAGDAGLNGMGTTLTAVIITGQDMFLTHIGDSRCYILNPREIMQVTRDHSVVQQMVDADIITQDEARIHPRRNEITRVLGYSRDTSPDLTHIRLFSDDIILLCTDGLSGVLSDELIAKTVLSSSDLNQASQELIDQANLAGGPDNISVIMAQPENLPSWQAVMDAQTSLRIK